MTDLTENRSKIPGLGAAWRWMRGSNLIIGTSAAWIVIVLCCGVFSEFIAPYDPDAIDLRARLLPPFFLGGTMDHPLGTDHLGRDLLSRLIFATRVSLLIAFVGTLIGAIIGTMAGFTAAYYRGLVDDGIMVLVDFQAAMPFLVIALAVLAFFGNHLVLLLALVGLYGWERYARLARGLALSAANDGYAVAAASYGARPAWIYWRHILPNTLSVLVVNATLNFPETVLLESSLSFLGLGVQPPTSSLGSILSYGRDYLLDAWWIAVSAGMMIFFTTLSISLIGDWLRDKLDPT